MGGGVLGSCTVTLARGVGLGQHYPTQVRGSCATPPPSPPFSVESCHWHTQVALVACNSTGYHRTADEAIIRATPPTIKRSDLLYSQLKVSHRKEDCVRFARLVCNSKCADLHPWGFGFQKCETQVCILPNNARLGSTTNPTVQKCTADFDFRKILNEINPTMHFRKICTVGFHDKPNRALCTLGLTTQGCVSGVLFQCQS